jgi:hypothetical protein
VWGTRNTTRVSTRYNEAMPNYRLVRSGSEVRVFVDGNPKLTVDANRRDEMRNYMKSVGLTPEEIDHKVHELYITNTTEFVGSR